jgi:hypothetical protein
VPSRVQRQYLSIGGVGNHADSSCPYCLAQTTWPMAECHIKYIKSVYNCCGVDIVSEQTLEGFCASGLSHALAIARPLRNTVILTIRSGPL